MRYGHREPAERVQKCLLPPRGQTGTTSTLLSLALSLSLSSHTRSAIKVYMCGATSFKSIKYKTLPYRISNHSIYRFTFSIKCKRYSNSTQFKFFFSPLNFHMEKLQTQGTREHGRHPQGSWEADSPSVWSLSAQRHPCKDTQVGKILGTLSFGDQVPLTCPG